MIHIDRNFINIENIDNKVLQMANLYAIDRGNGMYEIVKDRCTGLVGEHICKSHLMILISKNMV